MATFLQLFQYFPAFSATLFPLLFWYFSATFLLIFCYFPLLFLYFSATFLLKFCYCSATYPLLFLYFPLLFCYFSATNFASFFFVYFWFHFFWFFLIFGCSPVFCVFSSVSQFLPISSCFSQFIPVWSPFLPVYSSNLTLCFLLCLNHIVHEVKLIPLSGFYDLNNWQEPRHAPTITLLDLVY